MAELSEKTFGLLSSTPLVDMKTTSAKTNLYTVPTGKICIVTHIVVRTASATLAGGSDYDFGTGDTPANWNGNAIDFSSITATTHAYMVTAGSKVTVYAADAVFGIIANTGSTGAATATIDVFGYLYDA